jgi:hypothetical protein
VSTTSEVAVFRPDDCDALVAASFCCRYCLREPSVAIVDGPSDVDATSAVACRCEACGHAWIVSLRDEQSLRLHLRPPWRSMATVLLRA